MKALAHSEQDNELWVLLSQTKDAILELRQKELQRFKISAERADVLSIIQVIGDRATPAEIARRVLRQFNTVSDLLTRMEKDGLVVKTKNLERKNLVRVTLTEQGHKAHYQSTKQKSISKIMSSLSEEERQQLASCLQKLRNKALRKLRAYYKVPFPPSHLSALVK